MISMRSASTWHLAPAKVKSLICCIMLARVRPHIRRKTAQMRMPRKSKAVHVTAANVNSWSVEVSCSTLEGIKKTSNILKPSMTNKKMPPVQESQVALTEDRWVWPQEKRLTQKQSKAVVNTHLSTAPQASPNEKGLQLWTGFLLLSFFRLFDQRKLCPRKSCIQECVKPPAHYEPQEIPLGTWWCIQQCTKHLLRVRQLGFGWRAIVSVTPE